ncbi:MAG: twin-arginine translocase TatA/TatE family subunit [Prevotella sp.]|nr:twin-arginine translocase TatA/TatE family subunit [Prevotella sp.]
MTGMKTMLLFGLGGQEVLLIALVVLLLFGGAKIPELMRGLGKGVKSFKDGMKDVDEEVKSEEVRSEK